MSNFQINSQKNMLISFEIVNVKPEECFSVLFQHVASQEPVSRKGLEEPGAGGRGQSVGCLQDGPLPLHVNGLEVSVPSQFPPFSRSFKSSSASSNNAADVKHLAFREVQ